MHKSVLDLSDPFESQERWVRPSEPECAGLGLVIPGRAGIADEAAGGLFRDLLARIEAGARVRSTRR